MNKASMAVSIENSILAYIVSIIQSATNDNIKETVVGHFVPDDILAAKDALWDGCGSEVLGEKPSRRKTSVDKIVQDILDAFSTLDREDKTPKITIDALDLRKLPKYHPEECTSFSIAERLANIERQMKSHDESIGKNTAELIALKDRVDTATSYAAIAKGTGLRANSPGSTGPSVPGQISLKVPAAIGSKDVQGSAVPTMNGSRGRGRGASMRGGAPPRGGSNAGGRHYSHPLRRAGSNVSVASAGSNTSRKTYGHSKWKVVTGKSSSSMAYRSTQTRKRVVCVQVCSRRVQ